MAYTTTSGMTQDEVAQRLHMSTSEVRRIEQRAFQKLRSRVPRRALLAIFRDREFAAITPSKGQAA